MKDEGSRGSLSRDVVVATALAIVDRDGVDGLTMRALGRELGVDPMAAYHHVPNKSAILDGVIEAVWSELELPEPSNEPWQVQLEAIARAMRSTLRRHPNALPIMASRPNMSRPGLRLTDRTLGVLLSAGIPPRQALEFVNAAGEFILGHAFAEAETPDGDGDEEIVRAVATAGALEPFPHLTRVLADVELTDVSMDDIFDAGLRTLLAGLERSLS